MKLTLERAQKMMERSGSLYLRGTNITALPDGLQVGGNLDLEGTNITALPSGLVVAYNFYIRDTGISALPDDLTIGGEIYTDERRLATPPHILRDGDYVEGKYIYVDGILTSIKKTRKVQGYTLYIGKAKNNNVVSDGKNYAHCKTLREGIADLLFKTAKDRGAEQYKGLTLDSVVKTDEAIAMYRIITGACKQGTQQFLNSLRELKDAYTVREIIDLTKGRYGADVFKRFFE